MAADLKAIALITRVHPQRPNMLKKCIESVNAQTSDDYIHVLHRDDKTGRGYGKHNANRSFTKIKNIQAKYVMVLDDDDMLIDNDFIKEFVHNLETFKALEVIEPEIIFFRGIVHKLGILPKPEFWKKSPTYGQIASFCSAVRHDVWMKHIRSFGNKELGGDHCFIATCYKNTEHHFWWNRVVASTQKGPGRARGERDHA